MYSTYKNIHIKKMTNSEKEIRKDLETEVGTLANLKCITVFGLCWGHAFHNFLL